MLLKLQNGNRNKANGWIANVPEQMDSGFLNTSQACDWSVTLKPVNSNDIMIWLRKQAFMFIHFYQIESWVVLERTLLIILLK